MNSKYQIGVIGLGKFGFKFGNTLIQRGLEVIGVDTDPENVKRAQEYFPLVYQADATNKHVLEQLGFKDLTHVLVSVGDSIAASSMISLYLKELAVKNVWVKAINTDHEKLLRKIGVDEVIIPELMAATQLATKLAIPGYIGSLPFDKNFAIQELIVKEWAGKSLRDLDLTNRFSIQIIAVKRAGEENFQYIPKADNALGAGDALEVIGPIDKLTKIKS
ncbi:potassium channel family protein [Thiovibrio sp. JS02]